MLDGKMAIEGRPSSVPILGPGPWLLGRSADADVAFPDDRSCSREQALILRSGDGFILRPLSSSVPITVDGDVARQETPLLDGALLSFGVQRLMFTTVSDEPDDMTRIGRAADIAVTEVRRTLPAMLTIGRDAGSDDRLALNHPAVSRRHARVERNSGRTIIRDLGSTNGTFVDGGRITRPTPIEPGARIDIGPFQLTYDGQALTSVVRTGRCELSVRGVSVDVRSAKRGQGIVRILHDATFEIRPRELVCIIGASGSGKSTMMNVLSGRGRPSTGTVLINGVDLHSFFEVLKQDIAFVPQQDVLHEHLTLRQALDYSARLRLPPDTTAAQRREVVEQAAANVDLTERLDTRIMLLSGGQKKRASLASEILNRPSLLFLDEVTSGLDESTDAEIMGLLRRLASEGMTIVVVTHTLANLEATCHRAICMGRGGYPVFVGPPDEALAFFEVPRLGGVFEVMDAAGPQTMRARFEQRALETVVSGAAAVADRATEPPQQPKRSILRWARTITRQFTILVDRNVRLLLADRQAMLMAVVQGCLIGGLTGYVFGSFGVGAEAIRSKSALLFLLGLTAMWLGCNGGSKDIVGELPIYRRERDTNLSPLAFVLAKFVVSVSFTILQLGLVFLLTMALAESIPGDRPTQFLVLTIGALAGTALGLLISASCDTRDQATTIVPLVLVPQIVPRRHPGAEAAGGGGVLRKIAHRQLLDHGGQQVRHRPRHRHRRYVSDVRDRRAGLRLPRDCLCCHDYPPQQPAAVSARCQKRPSCKVRWVMTSCWATRGDPCRQGSRVGAFRVRRRAPR